VEVDQRRGLDIDEVKEITVATEERLLRSDWGGDVFSGAVAGSAAERAEGMGWGTRAER